MRGSTAGLTEGIFLSPHSAHGILLEVIDTGISAFVIAPAVVGYWRGTWNLMSHYLYPNDTVSSASASLVIGILGHLVFTIFQGYFNTTFDPNKHRLTFYIVSRVYTLVFGVICVNGWRGLWQLLDYYSDYKLMPVLITTGMCVVILALFRGLRNIAASPFSLATDSANYYFVIPTMYKISGKNEPILYVLDCTFSVVIIGSLVVFVWRGLWVIFDIILIPEDKGLSAIASCALGYGVVAITFAMQPLMRWTCDRLDGAWRIIAADLFLLFSFLGTINVWRGIWVLLDVYFLPENPELSDWLTHGVSIILLLLLNCSNSVLVRGVYIDAEEPAGQCVIFPVYYIRLFFQKERMKKMKRLNLDSIESQERKQSLSLLEKNSSSNHMIKTEKISSDYEISTK